MGKRISAKPGQKRLNQKWENRLASIMAEPVTDDGFCLIDESNPLFKFYRDFLNMRNDGLIEIKRHTVTGNMSIVVTHKGLDAFECGVYDVN